MMKNGFRIFFCLLLLNGFFLSYVHAQNLTGVWRGHFRSSDGTERVSAYNDYRGVYDDRYKIEVQIAQTSNRFEAVTYSYRSTEFYAKAEASGSLNAGTQKVLLKEGKLLEVRLASGFVCVMTCFMRYSKLGNDEYLQGTYYSTRLNDTTADCGKGSIFLHRVTESDFHKEPFLEKREEELLAYKKHPVTEPAASDATTKKLPPKKTPAAKNPAAAAAVPVTTSKKTEVKTAKAPVKKSNPKPSVSQPLAAQKKSTIIVPEQGRNTRDSSIKIYQPVDMPVPIPDVLKTRTNSLLKTLTVSHSNIELRVYDDGAIDNDTVSVYYDNKLIISRARLTDQPITFHIQVDPSDHPHQLVMVAENLGEIPPNTSLLVVLDGEKKYEERIISTEQKNVQINFQYKKME